MKIAVFLHTAEYRGDHSADICRVIDAPPDTTISELCDKLFGKSPLCTMEHIELRLVEKLP